MSDVSDMVAVAEVGFLNDDSFEESLGRLARAAAPNGVDMEALRTLITLTRMGHRADGTLSAFVSAAHVSNLVRLKLVHQTGPTRIDLV